MASLRKPILAANWKMNLGPTAASGFFESFLSRYAARAEHSSVSTRTYASRFIRAIC